MAKFKSETGEFAPTFAREWRKARGWVQTKLADELGVSVSQVSQFETGEIGYTQASLEAYARALGCSAADLLQRNPLIADPLVDAVSRVKDRRSPSLENQAAQMLYLLLNGRGEADDGAPGSPDTPRTPSGGQEQTDLHLARMRGAQVLRGRQNLDAGSPEALEAGKSDPKQKHRPAARK